MKDILQIPATLTKYESLANKAIKLTFQSQEEMRPELLSNIIDKLEKTGFISFAVRKIEADDLVNLPDIDATKYDTAKSPGQRLRAVIYRYWEQKGKQGDFNLYYLRSMERLIDSYKDKLT